MLSGLAPSTLVPAASAAVGNCTAASTWGSPRADFANRVVQLVNQHRSARGLVALTPTSSLTNAAVWKARHMAAYGYMAHNDPAPPVARSTGQRLEACGYPLNAGWGENIAAGQATPEAVMQAWLGSSGHRANIENPSFRAIGVGAAANSSGRLYWAQTFGTSTAGGGGSTAPSPVPGSVDCRTTPRSVAVGLPTLYGRTATPQLVGWTTTYLRHNGTSWVQGPHAPMRYAYATSTAPAQQWMNASGAAVAPAAVAQSIPQSGHWLAVQLFYWYDAGFNVVASSSSWTTQSVGGAAAGIPGASVCLWP